MTEIRSVYGTVIATGEGTIAEVVVANRANLRWANLRGADLSWADLRGANLRGADLSYVPSPLVLLAQWGELPDALTLYLMRYDADNHPEPESFLAWADGGPCPYSGLSVARVANFQERRGLIKADFLGLPVKSSWQLARELSAVKGFRFALAEVK